MSVSLLTMAAKFDAMSVSLLTMLLKFARDVSIVAHDSC